MMIPITRKEQYINEIVGKGKTAPGTPQTREEFFYAAILGEVVAPFPITNIEKYLAKIAGKYNGEMPEPITRIEFFIARAAGMNVSAPTPITREEMFWADYAAVAEYVMHDIPPLTFNAVAGRLKNYRIYGQTVDGESVGDRTGNLFYKKIENANISSNGGIYSDNYDLWIGKVIAGETYTAYNINSVVGFFTDEPNYGSYTYNNSRIVDATTVYTFTVPSGCSYVAIRFLKNATRAMLNLGDTAFPYEPYGYKMPVTVEGKNLLQNTATSQTINGVTFIVNGDGSVTCNGTATQTVIYMLNDTFSLKPGTYNLTGCPVGGGYVDKYKLDIVSPPTSYGTDHGNGSSFTLSSTLTNAQYRIVIYNNQTCNNLTFYPMIRKADIEDDTYEPYQPPITTNLYLPEQIKKVGDEAEYISYVDQKLHRVRKNLLQNTATSQTINGVTFTVNNDGSVTCNGTARNIAFFVISSEAFSLPVGRYKLNGAPTGGGQNYNFKLDVRVSTNKYYPDTGNGGQFSILQGEPITLCRIVIYSGYTCNNLTFYPMIRKTDIEDDTYEPYIENTDLDVALPALPTLTGTNVLSVGTEVQPSDVYIKYEGAR